MWYSQPSFPLSFVGSFIHSTLGPAHAGDMSQPSAFPLRTPRPEPVRFLWGTGMCERLWRLRAANTDGGSQKSPGKGGFQKVIFSLIFRGKVIDACCSERKSQGQNSKYTVKSKFPLNLLFPLPISEGNLINFFYLSKIICAYLFQEELYITLKNTTCNIPWMMSCTLFFFYDLLSISDLPKS